jgi:catechol 2,3-dioxygenase-like lactoylglutathione lyase family enzyme
MIRRVDRILIRVPQLRAAVTYYRDVLGLELVREDARRAALRLPDESVEIILHVDADLPELGVYFLVDDVRDLHRRRDELRLTFLSAPVKATRGYTATVKDPFGTILHLLDRTGDPSAEVEDAGTGSTLFTGVEMKLTPKRDLLARLYQQVGRTADDLPYTPHFEQLYEPYAAAHPDPRPSRAEVWRHLLNLRKGGRLPKLGEARSKAPALPAERLDLLRRILGKDIGKRDRLPYTERFDKLVDSFNQTLDRPLSPHLVWRAVATLAK